MNPRDLLPGATEDDSDRDGFLSTRPEVHAFGNGIYHGLVTHPLQRPPTPDPGERGFEDYDNEVHYWRAGYVVGTILQLAIAAYLAWHYGDDATGAVLREVTRATTPAHHLA